MNKQCGNCLWHFDLTGVNEDGEERNCLAAPAHMVDSIWMTKTATCMFPDKFCAKVVVEKSGPCVTNLDDLT